MFGYPCALRSQGRFVGYPVGKAHNRGHGLLSHLVPGQGLRLSVFIALDGMLAVT